MNGLKQILKQNSLANGLRNLYKNSIISDTIANKVSVRTPLNFTRASINFLKSTSTIRNSSNDISKRIQSLIPRAAASTQFDIHDLSGGPKKRLGIRKKRTDQQEKLTESGYSTVMAFATAEEYDLEKLLAALKTQDLYEPKRFFNADDNNDQEPDVLYAVAKYQVGSEPRDIYFFREGTVVMWNCSDMESSNVLQFLKNYEQVNFPNHVLVHKIIYYYYF